MMKKVMGWILALTLIMGASSALAVEKTNPVDQLTGAVWMQSTQENKNALIFGVECAITIEFFVAKKMDEAQNKAGKRKSRGELVSTLSPFEKGWAKAFENVKREKIVDMVDAWYTQHPDQLQRPVFDVLWNEFISPQLGAR